MSVKKQYRRWYSKSEGVWKEKTYEYATKRTESGKVTTTSRKRQSKLIVGKNGVYRDRLEDLLSASTDPAISAEIKAKVNEALRKGEKLSVKTLISKISTSKIEKAFINAGYTAESIEEEIGISSEVLFDESFWEGSTFTYEGKSYDFKFSYYGRVLIER